MKVAQYILPTNWNEGDILDILFFRKVHDMKGFTEKIEVVNVRKLIAERSRVEILPKLMMYFSDRHPREMTFLPFCRSSFSPALWCFPVLCTILATKKIYIDKLVVKVRTPYTRTIFKTRVLTVRELSERVSMIVSWPK